MRMIRRSAWVGLVCLLAAAGCEQKPPLGTAAGKVTYKGAPVAKGIVEFNSGKSGLAYIAPLAPDGTFKFQVADGVGLPPGSYGVSIGPSRAMPALGYVAPDYSSRDPADIPKKYRDVKSSGFTAEVKKGENAPFNFEME